MLETGSHHAVFGQSAVSHRKVDWQSGTWWDHLERWCWAYIPPHISPGDVHMGLVWCDQPEETPSSGFVIELITFCPIPFLVLLDLS